LNPLTLNANVSSTYKSAKIPLFQFKETAAMRFLSLFILGCFVQASYAAAIPDNLEPLAPPPPFTAEPEATTDDAEITIIKQTELTVEEFRSGGKIYMIKVTPKIGASYYLIDERGDGKFARQESLDSGFRPPKWIIHKF
jgi:hypothetical protein